MSEGALIWCPFGNEEDAVIAANTLLDERLVACANIMPAMHSIYIWRGERGDAHECGVLFKTRADLLDQAMARLGALHPYDSPAIIGWTADRTSAGTAAWLKELGHGGDR